jgi:hypothetical protein
VGRDGLALAPGGDSNRHHGAIPRTRLRLGDFPGRSWSVPVSVPGRLT